VRDVRDVEGVVILSDCWRKSRAAIFGKARCDAGGCSQIVPLGCRSFPLRTRFLKAS